MPLHAFTSDISLDASGLHSLVVLVAKLNLRRIILCCPNYQWARSLPVSLDSRDTSANRSLQSISFGKCVEKKENPTKGKFSRLL